jgi:PAS domain S-box-containing protein
METQMIEKTKQQWQSAADLMPQLVCLLNRDGHLLHISRTMERWGLGSVYSAKGRRLHKILHPDCTDPECYFERFWRRASMDARWGRPSECEAFDVFFNRHFQIQVQPLVRMADDTGNEEYPHTIVVMNDVSQLNQADAATLRREKELEQQLTHAVDQLVRSEELQMRLLAILEESTDYVAFADAAGVLHYLNPAGREMLGLAREEYTTHMKLGERGDDDARAAMSERAISAAIRSGIWSGESRMSHSQDREINTSQAIIANHGMDGQVNSLSTIIQNISERARIEQALRESQDELLRLSGLLVTIQEDERRRIALDLHDGLGQSLSLIKLSIETAAAQLATERTDEAQESLLQLIPRVKEALLDVRRVSTELRPSILDDLGILPTLSWFFREFEASCVHISMEKRISIAEQDVPASLKITLYRILQEATSNIVKHSCADRVRVSLDRSDVELSLLIEDNGCGFDPDEIVLREGVCRGLGLLSMKERVICSKGTYLLDSAPGQGTRIKATWPNAKIQAATSCSLGTYCPSSPCQSDISAD